MKIISLKNTKKTQPSIFKATLDDGKVFELHADAIVQYGLVLNEDVDEQVFISAQEQSEWLIACANAVNYLSRQLKTKKQLQTYLIKKGYSPAIIEKLIDKMADYKLIDDEQYAKSYTKSLQNSKSKNYIKNKLREVGIDANVIADNVNEISEIESAKKIVDKYFSSHNCEQKNIEKLIRHLQYKGYSWDTINTAIKNYKEEI